MKFMTKMDILLGFKNKITNFELLKHITTLFHNSINSTL